MLTKRDYWTITGLILVVVVLFQLINATRRSDGLEDIIWGAQSAARVTAEDTAGDEGR